jgi:hypothetical protein
MTMHAERSRRSTGQVRQMEDARRVPLPLEHLPLLTW